MKFYKVASPGCTCCPDAALMSGQEQYEATVLERYDGGLYVLSPTLPLRFYSDWVGLGPTYQTCGFSLEDERILVWSDTATGGLVKSIRNLPTTIPANTMFARSSDVGQDTLANVQPPEILYHSSIGYGTYENYAPGSGVGRIASIDSNGDYVDGPYDLTFEYFTNLEVDEQGRLWYAVGDADGRWRVHRSGVEYGLAAAWGGQWGTGFVSLVVEGDDVYCGGWATNRINGEYTDYRGGWYKINGDGVSLPELFVPLGDIVRGLDDTQPAGFLDVAPGATFFDREKRLLWGGGGVIDYDAWKAGGKPAIVSLAPGECIF